ncbi:MAG: ferredoxin--NADP reductase [Gammaproteobacteria bacterium]|nr:ferredoxin--NADP reductase [Gammaproteobacteria bacterium]
MSGFIEAQVTSIRHWNDTLFSFRTSRDASFRFKNGHFIMMGLQQKDKPLMRAYSIASANYEDELEFFSIKVPDGALTSQLKNVVVGDTILLSQKPTGTLLRENLLPGKNLYLLSTGTGLAPFISIIKDPEIYENFDNVILVHGVRHVSELAYSETITDILPNDEFLGEDIRKKLIYYPTVTREAFRNQGRLTNLMTSGKLFSDIGLPSFDPAVDRFMICGSPAMLKDCCDMLNERGFKESRRGVKGEYVIERAFVES